MLRLIVLASFCCVLVLLHAPSGHASISIDPITKANAQKIIDASLANQGFLWNRLAYITDTYGPRFSGSETLEQVIDYVVEQAKLDGLQVFEEPVMIPKWVRGTEYARLVSPSVRNVSLHMVGLGDSIGGHIIAEVLVVSSYDDLQQKAAQAVGKIVLFDVEFVDYGTTVDYRVNGPTVAAKAGAVGCLVRSIAPYGIQTPHAGVSITASIPAAAISLEDSKMLARMSARGQPVHVELYMEAHFESDVMSRNVIVQIQGSEKPGEYVTVGGHIDSWDIAPGAMDDGGGFSSAWEALRLIHQLNIQPKRTIRAIFYVNEENGARGGQAYAKDYANILVNTSLAIESDEGSFTPYGLRFSGSTSAQAILSQIGNELLSSLGSGNVTAGEGDTDIGYVCAQGVPCASLIDLDPRTSDYASNPCRDVLYHPENLPLPNPNLITRGYMWYHHTQADTIDKIAPEQLQRVAASLGVWVYSVANLDELLPRA